MELISVHDLYKSKRKRYYGASKKVYRKSDIDYILKVWQAIHYLSELHTRTRLVPANQEFLVKKAIPNYNNAVERLKSEYPEIAEIQRYQKITS
jgi:macrodomain Ter protein organizer (MatP/YcbG family)